MAPLILLLIQIHFLSLPPDNIWEKPGPSWSQSEPPDTQPACKTCETRSMSVKQISTGVSLIWGIHSLESTREVYIGEAEVKVECLGFFDLFRACGQNHFQTLEKAAEKPMDSTSLGMGGVGSWIPTWWLDGSQRHRRAKMSFSGSCSSADPEGNCLTNRHPTESPLIPWPGGFPSLTRSQFPLGCSNLKM